MKSVFVNHDIESNVYTNCNGSNDVLLGFYTDADAFAAFIAYCDDAVNDALASGYGISEVYVGRTYARFTSTDQWGIDITERFALFYR